MLEVCTVFYDTFLLLSYKGRQRTCYKMNRRTVSWNVFVKGSCVYHMLRTENRVFSKTSLIQNACDQKFGLKIVWFWIKHLLIKVVICMVITESCSILIFLYLSVFLCTMKLLFNPSKFRASVRELNLFDMKSPSDSFEIHYPSEWYLNGVARSCILILSKQE